MNIVFRGVDGSVALMTLVDGANKDEAIQKFMDSHPGEYLDNHVVASIKAPKNRIFRDAWKYSGDGKIEVDIKKAQEIHMNRIREVRNERLKELDIETLKNIKNLEELQRIEDQKQILRDIPRTLAPFNVKNPAWPGQLD